MRVDEKEDEQNILKTKTFFKLFENSYKVNPMTMPRRNMTYTFEYLIISINLQKQE